MSKQKIVVIGASEHAKVVIDIIEKEGRYEIAGLIDKNIPVGTKLLDYSVLGTEDNLTELITELDLSGYIIAIGDNFVRGKVADKLALQCPNLEVVKAVHPNAVIARDVNIGQGTVIMAGVTVNPSTTIGEHCILNTQSSLDHDCSLGDFASLAPGAITGGKCKIGQYSAICLGAKIIHGISIGEHTVVGAGALVVKNIEHNLTVLGIPAKQHSVREKSDKYL